MSPADEPELRSALARVRVDRQVSQAELAVATGLSLRTIQRLERKEIDNPQLRYLVNCALALDVPLEEIIDGDWLEWKVFDVAAAVPPHPNWMVFTSPHWNRSPHSAARQRTRARRDSDNK